MQEVMKSNKKKFYSIILVETITLIILITFITFNIRFKNYALVMGGYIHDHVPSKEALQEDSFKSKEDVETFFRPSKLTIINNTPLNYSFFDKYYDVPPEKIVIDKALLSTPQNVIINYYNLLREASYYDENSKKYSGCGSMGTGSIAYSIAYGFLADNYKSTINYKTFLNSFNNIYHINLIKLYEIPESIENNLYKKFFVEIETIEGSDKPMTNFGYYYGFIQVYKNNNSYKICSMDFYGEDFLCAPYHGWSWKGEYVVATKYGEWCKLVEGSPRTEVTDYIKKIYFQGRDGNEYMIEFAMLTNDTDVEIAQYKKNSQGLYIRIFLEPEKCL